MYPSNNNNEFGGEKFRGSSDIPLDEKGLQKGYDLAQQLARKGGLDRLLVSDLTRTRQTAAIINKYTRAPIVHSGPELHPWHLGELEGQPVTQDAVDFINHLVTKEPDFKIPGAGPLSIAQGESFNDFKNRALPFIDQALREHISQPQERTGLVTHYRVKKLVDSWVRAGAEADYKIDPGEMLQKGDAPGTITRLHYDPRVGVQLSEVDPKTSAPLPGGDISYSS